MLEWKLFHFIKIVPIQMYSYIPELLCWLRGSHTITPLSGIRGGGGGGRLGGGGGGGGGGGYLTNFRRSVISHFFQD